MALIKKIILILGILGTSITYCQNDPDINFREGIKLFEEENYKGALDKFNRAILFERKKDSLYFYRAKTRIEMDRLSFAIQDLKSAIRINPNIGIYYSLLAYTLYKSEPSNDKKNAKYYELASKSVELNPNQPFNNFVKAKFSYLTNRYSDAIVGYTQALIADSTNAELYYYRGKSRMEFGDIDGQKDVFKARSLGFKKFNRETELLWKEYVIDNNKIDSNFYTNPQNLLEKVDSMVEFNLFKNSNQILLRDLGKAIFSLPINECKNKYIKILIGIDSIGQIISAQLLDSNINQYLSKLITDTITNFPLLWSPYTIKGVPKEYYGEFTFGVRNVDVSEVKYSFKNDRTFYKSYSTPNHVYRIPVTITSYWVSSKVSSDYIKDCEDNNHYYNEGIKAFEEEKYAIAKSYFKKALKSNYYDLDARYNLGISYQKLEKLDDACECFKFCSDLGDKQSTKIFNNNCK